MCTFFNRDKLALTHKSLLRLRADYGFAGLGMYYRLLELMVYDDDHYLDHDMAFLSVALGLRTAKEREMLSSVLRDYDLFAFTEDETEFYSPSLMSKEGTILRDNLKYDDAFLRDNLKDEDTILRDNLKDEAQILKPNLKKRPYNLKEEKRAILRENAKNARQSKKSNLKNGDAILRDNLKDGAQILEPNLKDDNANLKNEAPNLNETCDLGGNKKGGLSCSLEGIGENISPKAINEEKESQNNFLKDRGCGGKETKASRQAPSEAPQAQAEPQPSDPAKVDLIRSAPDGFTPPTFGQVEARCHEMNYPEGTAQAWYDYQKATGWRVGRKPMKDWKMALAYWASHSRKRQGAGQRPEQGTSPRASTSPTIAPGLEARRSPGLEASRPEAVEMRLAFEAYYRERTALSFCWSEREHTALVALVDKLAEGMREQGLPITPQTLAETFRHFLALISDPWILDNLSPHILNLKYNEIRSTSARRRPGGHRAKSHELDDLERAADALLRASGGGL